MEKGGGTSRRSFLNYIIGLGFVGFGLHLLRSFALYVWPPKEITQKGRGEGKVVLNLDDIPEGESKKIIFKGEPYIVIRKEGNVYVLSAKCTHLGCLVNWEPDVGEIICPCHAARFSLSGSVLGGPAPKPLTPAPVKVEDGKIIIG